jgi:hypothetical protein
MSEFTVQIYDRNWTMLDLVGVDVAPVSWDAQATGGCIAATLRLTGTGSYLWNAAGWLGYHVRIINALGTPVWWGMISRATLTTGATRITIDAANVRNRILIDYSYEDGDGLSQEGVTAWGVNAASVARYGAMEERIPLSDTDPTAAASKRDTWLTKSALPQPSVEWDDSDPGLDLECMGYWPLLENVYYEDATGRIVYDESSNIEHLIGWSLSDVSSIGFDKKVAGYSIHDLHSRMYGVTVGTMIDITGTVNNNRSVTITGVPTAPDGDYVSLAARTDIFFASNDEIFSADTTAFDKLRTGEMILVWGTGNSNSRFYWIQTIVPGDIEVYPSTVVDEAMGDNVSMQQGHHLTAKEFIYPEDPHDTNPFTLKSRGVRVAQSFQISGSTAWAAHEAMLRIRKVDSPPADLLVRLYSDVAGTPTTVLAQGTLTAANVKTVSEWVTIPFATPYTLQPSTTYWLAVSGYDAGSNAGAYTVALNDDSETQYAGGTCKIQIGSGAWETRWGEAVSMPFQVWGKVDASTQLATIITTSSPYVTGSRVRALSGATSRQYKDGKQRAMYEAQELVDTGDPAGLRLSVDINEQRIAVIGVETAESSIDETLCPRFDVKTGRLNRADGGPMEPGVLPYGQTIMLDGTEDTHDAFSRLQRLTAESIAFDADNNTYRIDPKQRRQPWEIS